MSDPAASPSAPPAVRAPIPGPLPDPGGRLGFGLMRLPRAADGRIDIPAVCAMTDRFLGAGFRYFDTAWAYEGSEEAARDALVRRHPRESFLLATKCAAWMGDRTREASVAQFDTSLRRTEAGHFDFYLLHNLGGERTRDFERFGLWEWAVGLRDRGLVGRLGFSFHAGPDELDAILRAHPEVDFVQLQVNWADWDSPLVHSRENLAVARSHGKPVVVMEPVKGGLLARPPAESAAALREVDPARSPAAWALSFAASREGVYVALSGMGDLAQMEENVAAFRPWVPFGPDREEAILRAREALGRVPVVPCTSCRYCEKVCPAGIGVAGTFAAENQLRLFGDAARARNLARWQVLRQGRRPPSECLRCGRCAAVCPQGIAIPDELAAASPRLFPADDPAR